MQYTNFQVKDKTNQSYRNKEYQYLNCNGRLMQLYPLLDKDISIENLYIVLLVLLNSVLFKHCLFQFFINKNKRKLVKINKFI